MIARSLHFAFDVPNADASLATLFYPADDGTLDQAKLTGVVAAEPSRAPWPVTIIMPGINVAPDSYRWLAIRLVEAGHCAVTYQTIGSLGPAGKGITPGIDLAALAPEVVGQTCSATAVAPLLASLEAMEGPVAGLLDLSRLAIGGHSAGGTTALHNSNLEWIPGLRCVFSYAGHTMVSRSLGHDDASVVQVPSKVPMMVLVGASDEVIAASRSRYRSDDADHSPVERTFEEGLTRDANDSWFVELAGGNHFSICDPVDETSGRSFLEPDLRADDTETRNVLAELIVAFVDEHCRDSGDQARVATLVAGDGVSAWRRR